MISQSCAASPPTRFASAITSGNCRAHPLVLLQQQDTSFCIPAETIGEYGSRRSAADDDHVK